MHTFQTLELSKDFYQRTKKIRLPYFIKNQLQRAALSVCLNLSEGNQRRTKKDQLRFFNIAIASLRECQTLIEIENFVMLSKIADHLGASLYKLINHYHCS